MSTISRRDGSGGKMYVPRDRYSLTMSFWVVPRSAADGTPCVLGVGDVEAEQPRRGGVDRHRRVHLADAGSGRAACRMWPRWATGTPTLPTSPRACGVVGVVAGLGGEVEGDRQAGLALGQVRPVQLVRRRGRGVARVGPHHPRLVALGQGRVARVLGHGPSIPRLGDPCHDCRLGTGAGRLERRGRWRWQPARGSRSAGDLDRRRAWRGGRSTTGRRAASAPPARRRSTRPTSATLEASRRWWNIDSPANRPPMRDAVEAADELAARASTPRRCGPSRVGAAACRRRRTPVDPAPSRRTGPHAAITSANAVSTRTSYRRSERRSERGPGARRAGGCRVGRGPPADRLRATGMGNRPPRR